MSRDQDWINRRYGLAERLRTIRERAGASGKDFAGAAGWHPSKVSRIETGQQTPTSADVETWVRMAGQPDTLHELLIVLDEVMALRSEFRRRMRDGQAQVQTSYNELVQDATFIRHFETTWVPGLLQTADYARRIFTEMATLHDLDVKDLDAAVTARLQRQQYLYDPAKRFEFLLCEPVLRWVLPSRSAMRGQLDRLQTIIGAPNIRFGVIPMGAELAVSPQNAVQMYDDLAITETFVGETYHRDEEAEAYGRAIDRMWSEAVEGEEVREFIVTAMRAL
jgi:transcriptional regulator with XRE-family HTH domain